MKKIFSIIALAIVAMTATAKAGFELTSESAHGTITFKIDGETVTTAEAGKTVTVAVSPTEGWQTKEVTARAYTDWGGAKTRGTNMVDKITVSGSGNEWSFTMPEANVKVTATYKQLIAASWITLGNAAYTYDGKAKEPTVTLKNGNVTIPASAYSVAYANNVNAAAATADNAPTVTVTITNSDDYAGQASKAFTIDAAELTELVIKDSVLTYAYAEMTVEVVSVKAGNLEVPATGYTLSGNKATEVGNYTATATGSGNYKGTATATYRIKEAEPTIDIEAKETTEEGEEGKEVEDVTMVMKVADDAAEKVTTETRTVTDPETGQTEEVTVTVIPIVLESINVPEQTATNVTEITVTVPSEIVDGNVVYKVTEIKADAFKKKEGDNAVVTKVILPDTEEPLVIEEGALKPDNKLLDVVTPLQLLDDYSLDNKLKDNFEANKISAYVTPVNKYWSFSSGVDCVLPAGVTAYIATWDAEFKTPRISPLEEEQLKLKDGRRGIKANNGVLIAGEKDNTYEIVASPGNQESGTKPAIEDADSYEGNCLVPTIEAKNYEAGKYLILKNNMFHTIKSNASKVKACKAVFSMEKANK